MLMDTFLHASLGTPEFELLCNDGPDTEWVVSAVVLDEQVDRPYRAQIDIACTSSDHADFLGASCELVFLRDEERRRLSGIVSEVEVSGFADHHYVVRLVLVPAFALLGQSRNSRIWQQASVRDIVTELLDAELGAYDRCVDFGQVERGDEPREVCVQYRESDLDFVTRLLAEEGTCFRFAHTEGPEQLVLHDQNEQYPAYENTDGGPEVPIIPERADEAVVESVQTCVPIRRLTPTTVWRRDFDWHAPRELLTSEVGEPDERGRSRRRHAHGQRRFCCDDLEPRASDLLESLALPGAMLRGSSNAMGFVAGMRFTLAPDDDTAAEGEYLLTRVIHHASQGEYCNDFECVPIDVPLRPRARPRPRVHGPQTAIVVGDDGEEIHTDEHGRVRVQFYWEAEPTHASEASCWIRCAQSLAGPGLGAQFIPRVGMEVVVEFLEGNPDRPLITGCVYNGDHSFPFPLPDEKTKSGWRTRSVPGSEGHHELSFEDTAGAEAVHLRSQKDLSVLVLNDASHSIGHDRSCSVGHDETASVGHDQTASVGNDRTLTIGANHHEIIGANRSMTIAQNLALTVGINSVTGVGGSQTTTVGGDASLSVGKNLQQAIKQDSTFEAENATWKTRANTQVNAGKQMAIDVGDKFGLTVAADITIDGKAKAKIEAKDKLTLTCGKAAIVLESNGDITINGKKLTLKGSGEIVMTANKIKGN